jgi:hypothetical protein
MLYLIEEIPNNQDSLAINLRQLIKDFRIDLILRSIQDLTL